MYQHITIVGNLGRDPELRYLQDGTPVCNMSIATNRRFQDRNGNQQDQTTWFRVAVWGNQAEACNEYLAKGRQVLVAGRLKADPETGGPRMFTRQDGTVGTSYEVRAFSVQFLGSPDDAEYDPESHHESPQEVADDIPF